MAETIEQALKGVEKLIYSVAWRHCRAYGGDIDDMISLCYEAFVDAFRTFDPTKGKFSARVWALAWFKMFRTEEKRKKAIGAAISEDTEGKEVFSVNHLLEEVSNDARRVLKMVLEPPIELMSIEGLRPQPHKTAACVRALLRGMGWTGERIGRTFQEIKEALS